MKAFVSILIPCYNAGPWVAQAIQSALDQTYHYKEVIVVDDGSSDNSLEVVRSFGNRIRYETGPNRGGNVVRNRLLHLANGDWLEFLDADDYLFPNKIEKQIQLILDKPELEVIYGPYLELYGNGALEIRAPVIDDDLFANYFRWLYFTTTVLLLRKSAVQAVGGWKEDQKVCQEHELVLRLIKAGKKFALAPEALGVNRIQYDNSVSRRSPLNTLLQRMALSDNLEEYLKSRGEMTEERRVALAQARFLSARSAYLKDPVVARNLCAKALATGPFVPPCGVNRIYQVLFRLFGFESAELVAKAQRKVFGTKVGK